MLKNKNKQIKQSVIPEDTFGNNDNNDTKNEIANSISCSEQMNIDDVFIRITHLYSQELYNIIYNTLLIMKNSEINNNNYIEGLNKILEPTNIKIKKWIDENILF